MKHLKAILAAFLIGITVFSLVNYAMAVREKYALINSLNQLKSRAASLEIEKQNLLKSLEKEKEAQIKITQENADLKEQFNLNNDKLMQMTQDLEQAQNNIKVLGEEIESLKLDKSALGSEKDRLNNELKQANAEIERLMSKLDQFNKSKPSVNSQAKSTKKSSAGNKGYIIKAGDTSPDKVKIEVTPVSSGDVK